MRERSDRLDDETEERGGTIAFRAPPHVVAAIEAAAAHEGISKSDIARRALIRDLRQAGAAV